ncbi:histidine phosphatase family protein [Lactobacillus sp. DCY120]|uniref:Histidine phosphatase family protein n=1 Tax=Bombilactobacillus apium TaxID=2675299 RepID=A0A850R4D4_9LACO|nr:histidine phosphatase family protein [Bombilactobacillus apium]NVY95697.1 histidine phosphatase family protein [Bombilactobacillus apium]
MKFYFVRHGKTEWNLEGRYQGAQGDSALLPESYTDIHLLANFLSKVKIDHIYSSPIRRAYLTARTLADDLGGQIPVTTNPALKEFDLGLLEGQKFVDVEAQYPELIWAFRHDPSQYNAQVIQGESFLEVIARTNHFIQQLAQKATPTANYVIVSHGAALTAMIKSLLSVSLQDLRKDGGLSNTSLTTVETNDHGQTFQLLDWNNTSYLKRDLDQNDTI